METWLLRNLFSLCFIILYLGSRASSNPIGLPPNTLQTNGNATNLMPGGEWRKDKATCKAKEFFMTIGDDTCTKKTIKNHFCIGYCNSLYIPQYPRRNVRFCNACLPTAKVKRMIALNCVRNGKSVVIYEEVTFIHACKCMDVQC